MVIGGMFYYCSVMPYERVIAVEVECPACRRCALVAPHRLHDRFASFERMTQICRRMRCRRCGSAGGMGWNIVRASPQDPAC
jgi:hypothetical protein